MATIFGASPRVTHITKSRHNNQDVYKEHWTKSLDDVNGYQATTASDAMQLYSIGAGQLVMVQNTGQPWDHEYELSAKRKNVLIGKQHKFVTETVTYGVLKIRSEENNMYICAKSNGNIIFKESADNIKKNQPRRRCLFMWSFTKEKHIQLSVKSGDRKEWYLAVKDGIVKLMHQTHSSPKERSFIWLPTSSSKVRPRNPRKSGRIYSTRARGFSLEKTNDCKQLKKQLKEQLKLKFQVKVENDTNHSLDLSNKNLTSVNIVLVNEVERLKMEVEKLRNLLEPQQKLRNLPEKQELKRKLEIDEKSLVIDSTSKSNVRLAHAQAKKNASWY